MKKYARAAICFSFTLVKFCFLKVFHWNNFKFSLLELFSPFTEVDVSTKGNLTLGRMVRARSGSRIRVRSSGNIVIGNNSSLNHGCIFTCHDRIVIGENVQFGPNVLIYDHDHDFRASNGLIDLKYITSPVEIGNNVWVGANVVILRGTCVGDNCVIGAGAVVTGNFPNNSIIVQKREIEVIPYEFATETN